MNADQLRKTEEAMKKEAESVRKQAYEKFSKYGSFIKLLQQKKNIGDRNNPYWVTIEMPYMMVDGRVQMCIDEHLEKGAEMPDFGEPKFYTPYPDSDKVLCTVKVKTIRGNAPGTIEVNIGGNGADSTNPFANAETSALGRALGFLGYGLIGGGFATYEEMESALAGKDAKKEEQKDEKVEKPKTTGQVAGAENQNLRDKVIKALVEAGFKPEDVEDRMSKAKTAVDLNALLIEAGDKKKNAGNSPAPGAPAQKKAEQDLIDELASELDKANTLLELETAYNKMKDSKEYQALSENGKKKLRAYTTTLKNSLGNGRRQPAGASA